MPGWLGGGRAGGRKVPHFLRVPTDTQYIRDPVASMVLVKLRLQRTLERRAEDSRGPEDGASINVYVKVHNLNFQRVGRRGINSFEAIATVNADAWWLESPSALDYSDNLGA